MRISYLMYEPAPDPAELTRRIDRVAALGYAGIELVATPDLLANRGAVAAAARARGLPIVSLLSGWSYANEGLCLSSPDPGVRRRAVARLGDYAGLAGELGAIVVVGLMQGLRSDEPDEDVAGGRIAECLGDAAEVAGHAGVEVVLEPVNHQQVGFHNTIGEAAALARRVGAPNLGFMLDTFHMNIEERSVVGATREHAGAARHVHLCESNGGPFGSGGLDFRGVLAALDGVGYDRWASVKIYRKATWDEAARQAADYLRRLGVAMG